MRQDHRQPLWAALPASDDTGLPKMRRKESLLKRLSGLLLFIFTDHSFFRPLRDDLLSAKPYGIVRKKQKCFRQTFYEKICLRFWRELPLGFFRIRQNVVFDGERGSKRNVHIRSVLCLVYEKQTAGSEETKYN